MAYELRLCEADQERFERGGEWFRFDLDELFSKTPVGVQEDIEEASNYTLAEFALSLGRHSTKAFRWRMWVARYLAGVREPFADFDPSIHQADVRDVDEEPVEGDASPPEEAPETPGQAGG